MFVSAPQGRPWPIVLAFLTIAGVFGVQARAAQPVHPADNVVQISIVNSELKVTHRGVGICRSPTADCANAITWRWIGADPSAQETEKIVIQFITGTAFADRCFVDGSNQPQTRFEISERNTGNHEVTATVSPVCPPKSAWIYEISCERTDAGHEGEPCTGIAPLDPGAVIG